MAAYSMLEEEIVVGRMMQGVETVLLPTHHQPISSSPI